MSIRRLYLLLLVIITIVWWQGCTREAPLSMDPPTGWEGDRYRWWRAGQDTVGIFRKMETLEDMAVTGAQATYVADMNAASRQESLQKYFERGVKQSLVTLYRHEPALIDSLVEYYVVPRLQKAEVKANEEEDLIEKYKKDSYKQLRNHFREPLMVRKIGQDVPVPYPDSLQEKSIRGSVQIQVRLDAEGQPVALQLLGGIHPTLDFLAMKATTEMVWGPAYRRKGGRWVAIPCWVRFSVRFG